MKPSTGWARRIARRFCCVFYEQLRFSLHLAKFSLGTNEAVAQKRVSRALEKLHVLLKHRGVALSLAALGTALAGEAVKAAPAGLAVRISIQPPLTAAIGGGGASALLRIITMTKLQKGITAMIVAGAAAILVVQHQAQLRLRGENQALRRQIAQLQSGHETHAPRLARPPRRIAARPAAPDLDARAANPNGRLAKMREPVKLTREQAEAYLKAYGRNAATLLTAFRASDDPALLQEAMDKFPNDPRVDFAAIFKPGSSPEEQRQWLPECLCQQSRRAR